jgi:hypothetical protein
MIEDSKDGRRKGINWTEKEKTRKRGRKNKERSKNYTDVKTNGERKGDALASSNDRHGRVTQKYWLNFETTHKKVMLETKKKRERRKKGKKKPA